MNYGHWPLEVDVSMLMSLGPSCIVKLVITSRADPAPRDHQVSETAVNDPAQPTWMSNTDARLHAMPTLSLTVASSAARCAVTMMHCTPTSDDVSVTSHKMHPWQHRPLEFHGNFMGFAGSTAVARAPVAHSSIPFAKRQLCIGSRPARAAFEGAGKGITAAKSRQIATVYPLGCRPTRQGCLLQVSAPHPLASRSVHAGLTHHDPV